MAEYAQVNASGTQSAWAPEQAWLVVAHGVQVAYSDIPTETPETSVEGAGVEAAFNVPQEYHACGYGLQAAYLPDCLGRLLSALEAECATLCTLWRIRRRDGVVLGFTDHDRPIVWDGTTFEPAGGLSATATERATDLSVDNLDIEALLISGGVEAADIAAGVYDGARVDIFICDWEDVCPYPLAVGWTLGQAETAGGGARLEVRSLSQAMQVEVGDLWSRECRAVFGDADCGVSLAAWTVTGVVTAVADRSRFADSMRTEPEHHFRYGLVRWTTGANAGREVEVRAFDGAGGFALAEPMPEDIEIGDEYEAVAGCDKLHTTCRTKFANIRRFRGEYLIPVSTDAMEYPDAH